MKRPSNLCVWKTEKGKGGGNFAKRDLGGCPKKLDLPLILKGGHGVRDEIP